MHEYRRPDCKRSHHYARKRGYEPAYRRCRCCEKRDDRRRWEKWIAPTNTVFNGLLFAATAFGGCLVLRQLDQNERSIRDAMVARVSDAKAAETAQADTERHNRIGEAAVIESNDLTRRVAEAEERNLVESRKALIADRRAWLIPRLLSEKINLEAPSDSCLKVKNVGSSPAITERQLAQTSVRPGRLTGLPEFAPDAESNVGMLATGEDLCLNHHFSRVPEHSRNQVREGNATLYVLGFVEYRDQLTKGRTDYCFYWEIKDESWRFCPWGNSVQ